MLWIYDKNIINFLLELGYSFGPKSKTVFIPDKILQNKNLSVNCLRGIFNSDGFVYGGYSKKCVGHKRFYNNYFNVQYKSKSQN